MRIFDLRQLDPWVASSLLQKAIRRGEADIACQAADAYRHHRGKGIWRRLITIACEDVGIAAPDLIAEVIWLSSDPDLRSVVGDDETIMYDLCQKLSAAPKDRSTDYLYSAAMALPAAHRLRSNLTATSLKEQVAIVADRSQSLLRRAVAMLLAGSASGAGAKLVGRPVVEALLDPVTVELAENIQVAMRNAALRLTHPFVLMLPILMTALYDHRQETEIVSQPTPPMMSFRGLPLYAFDVHTHVGKQAIARLIPTCAVTDSRGIPKAAEI